MEEWRSQSTRGRYESAMWRAAGLEEPNGKWKRGAHRAAATWEGGEQVDNMTAGGFFGWYGRERDGPQRARPTVMPAPVPVAERPVTQAGTQMGTQTTLSESSWVIYHFHIPHTIPLNLNQVFRSNTGKYR